MGSRPIESLHRLCAAGLLLVASAAFAQSANTENTLKLDDGAIRPKATIDAMQWLVGFWEGESSLGAAQEVWMAPFAGTMAGAFKVTRDGQPYFYEFVEISEDGGSLILKVKHFDPALTGWEERDEFVSFPLVKLGEREAYFSGLTYRRTSDDELRAYVATRSEGGDTEELEFVFRRPADAACAPAPIDSEGEVAGVE